MNKFEQLQLMQSIELQNIQKVEAFKERISCFAEITTLDDAKYLAQNVLRTDKELDEFYIGNAKYTVLNQTDRFKICFDSPNDYICYDFN